jgi:hypothetical protein
LGEEGVKTEKNILTWLAMGETPTKAATDHSSLPTLPSLPSPPATETTDGLLNSLKGLVLGAIVGVASFQILAPNVWGYIHEALNLSYKLSYWIFTVVYFLTMPVCMLFWLGFNWKTLIGYFLPYEHKDKIEKFDAGILRGLFAFICVQLLVAAVTFRIYFSNWFYWMVLSFYFAICGGFLIFYGLAARKRMQFEYPGPAAARPVAITKYYRQLILVSVPVYLVIFIGAFLYLNKWQDKKGASHYVGKSKSAFNAGSRGFALGSLKDSVDSRYASLGKIEDSIRYNHRHDALDSIDAVKYYVTGKILSDTIHIKPDSALVAYYQALVDSGQSINKLFRRLRDTSVDVGERSIIYSSQHIPFFPNYAPNHPINSIDDLHYIQLLKNDLAQLSKEVDTQSQAQLGLQLQGVQLKGMVLLISLFFTLFSLFVYLSICKRVLQVKQSDDAREITALSNNLWLYLTIIVWLLVPLFKPVKDADIDVKQTYKTHTFGGYGG